MARKTRVVIHATGDRRDALARLYEIRRTAAALNAEAELLVTVLVDAVGDADAITSGEFEATLARCEGNVGWKSVSEGLIVRYDAPPSVVQPLIVDSKGKPYVRLLVKAVSDG